jgi:hypothetical protein
VKKKAIAVRMREVRSKRDRQAAVRKIHDKILRWFYVIIIIYLELRSTPIINPIQPNSHINPF